MKADSFHIEDRNRAAARLSTEAAYMNLPLDGSSGAAPVEGGSAELRRLLEMMRGRWLWAIAAMGIGAFLGGYAGMRSGHKIYASTGQMRVVAVVPRVLYSVEDKDVPQMFDSFVDSQVALLQSQRVMELATQDPSWLPLGRPPSDAAVQTLMHSIEVAHGGELITVKAVDLDPNVAVTSVRSVIGAFEKIYEEGDAESNEKRLVVLQNIQATKGNELASIREEIASIARPYGTDDLQPLFNMKQSTVEALETSINNAEADLSAAIRSRAGDRLAQQYTPEQWASVNQDIAGMIKDRTTAKHELDVLLAQNLLENNRQVVALRAEIAIDDKAIQDLAAQLQARHAAGLLPLPTPQSPDANSSGASALNPDALREQIDALRKRRDAAKVEMIAVGDQQLKISELKYKADQAIRERDAAQQRIDQLNTEATINGRVTIISSGDRPLSPYKDSRVTFAAAGVVGGGFLGFAGLLLIAFFDRRLRSPDETGALSPELLLLGLLPRLPKDPADTADDARAAHCVTGVRNLLHLSGRAGNHRSFVITSPAPAAGKTSLTFALGVSYATARSKTLMIDCDLVGGGLTSRAQQVVTRKLGRLLISQGLLTEDQLTDALGVAERQSRRLGEVIVERGWLAQADMDRLLAVQREDRVGLLDALDGTPLEQCVAATGIVNLTLLPIGNASSRDVPLLSVDSLKKLIESAREFYQIVLIDTGPVPGSLEAQLVAAVADAAIVVVTPGMRRPLIRNCVNRLSEVGARVAGVVYNRASEREVFTYTSGSQSRVSRALEMQRLPSSGMASAGDSRLSHYGPLASAVSRSAPAVKAVPLPRTARPPGTPPDIIADATISAPPEQNGH